MGVGASAGSASDPRGLAQSYVLAFNSPSPDVSLGSSVGSLPSSPSPTQATSPLAAYRGRRAATGRTSLWSLAWLSARINHLFIYVILILFWSAAIGALDGSLLARLTQGDSDSDADE